MKRCNMCGETKSEVEFSRKRDNSDGLNSRCRECASEAYRRYSEENPEINRERQRRYQERNPGAAREASRLANRESRQIARKYASKLGRYSLEEDLVVMRTDMTILEIAIALGRTYNSVGSRRRYLRKKEKTNV